MHFSEKYGFYKPGDIVIRKSHPQLREVISKNGLGIVMGEYQDYFQYRDNHVPKTDDQKSAPFPFVAVRWLSSGTVEFLKKKHIVRTPAVDRISR